MTPLASTSLLAAPDTAAPTGFGSGRALRGDNLAALVSYYAANPELWLDQLRFPTSDRWWTRLHADAQVDVWLLSWLPGHATDLHDHGTSGAAFTVVQGRLEEVRLDAAGEPVSVERAPGEAVLVAPREIHDVRAIGERPAVSIHAYSPRLVRMTYYAFGDDGALRAVRTVDSDEPEQETPR